MRLDAGRRNAAPRWMRNWPIKGNNFAARGTQAVDLVMEFGVSPGRVNTRSLGMRKQSHCTYYYKRGDDSEDEHNKRHDETA